MFQLSTMDRLVTLAEVEQSFYAREEKSFYGVRAYMVNFRAELEYPRRFTYLGCTRTKANGRFCARSVEVGRCDHQPCFGYSEEMFRFDIFLTDGSGDGHPVLATIFEAAGKLLDCKAREFRTLSETDQMLQAYKSVLPMPLCEMWLTVGKKGIVIQSLKTVTVGNRPFIPRSPARSPAKPMKERKSKMPAGFASSSGQASRFYCEEVKEKPRFFRENVQEKLAEVMDMLSGRHLDLSASSDDEE